jgi:prepilin signal peptidase PulO-like enzyme (type II secretory pathway)
MENYIFASMYFIFGAILGSAASAFAYRIKYNKSYIFGRSECPHCKKQLSVFELIPIFSFLALRGKCSKCKKRISLHYPLIEIVFGSYLFLLSYLYLLGNICEIQFIIYSVLGFALIVIVISDLLFLEIPDFMQIILLILSAINVLFGYINPFVAIFSALFSATFFYLIFKYGQEKKMGFGDVKLAFNLGFFFNFFQFIIIVIFSSFLGIIFGIIYAKLKSKEINKVRVPLGSILSLVSMFWLIFTMTHKGIDFLEHYDLFVYLFK